MARLRAFHNYGYQRKYRGSDKNVRSPRLFLIVLYISGMLVLLSCASRKDDYEREALISLLETQKAASLSPIEATRIFLFGEIDQSVDDAVREITAETTPLPLATPQPPVQYDPVTTYVYYTQSGDTLPVLAVRYGVAQEEIESGEPIASQGFLKPGQLLFIPRRLQDTGPGDVLYPDSEVVYGPSAKNMDVGSYVDTAGGHLSSHGEFINDTQWLSGAQLVDRIATGNSLNPRLLLLLLEYQSNWVYGEPEMEGLDYPMGYQSPDYKGLYRQLIWAAMQISVGYYGWRDGKLAALTFPDGSTMRLAPNLNAGSVALQYLFSKLYNPEEWYEILYGPDSIIVFSTLMFDDPWLFAQISAPMIPWGLQQPQLELPFLPGTRWNFTGGPHGAWERYGSMGGLDFSPAGVSGCKKSEEWVTAAAPGVVVRSEEGIVMLDLDGDGSEYTGWNLLHLHIASDGRVDNGIYLETDGRIGHPSCERGFASGSHVHIARKYNGEWIAADGPLPFVLGGWQVHAGESAYRGTLTRDGQVIQTSHHGAQESLIIR